MTNSTTGIKMSYWGHSVFSTPVKYHGLFNQGATCYLNSVLQVLFMSKDFRAAVKRHTSENPDTEYIDRHLTTLFDQLSDNPAHTCQITEKLNINTVYEQRDAAEYFEKLLRLTSPEASQIFHGLLTHKTTCSVCLEDTDTDGPFWHLPLALVDSYSGHYSVKNGIEEYFRASDLSGENQIYCEKCDAKTDGNIKCVMKHHPEVLMLLLKRFEIDYRYMAYVKINSTVEIPCTLQMPENQTYELYAVVEHFGDLRCGHYTAMIKDDEKWYNFNDDMVTLPSAQPFQVDTLESSRSAYLLFYRKHVHATDTCIQDIKESTPGIIPPAAADICDKYQEREEIEEAADVSNGTAGTVSINRNEETRIKDRVGSGEEGLPVYNIEKQDNGVNDRQSIPSNHQGSKGANIRKQRGEGKITINDDGAMETNAETDDQKENRESSSIETQLEESFEDRDSHNARLVDVRQRRAGVGLHGDDNHKMLLNYQEDKQDLSNIHARQEYSPQVRVDMHRDEEMVDEDMDGQMEGDKLSEKREEASTMHPDSDVQYEGNERGGTQEVKLVSADKQEHEERLEMNVKIDKDTCIQDIKEFTPGIIPPAANICDKYQDSVKKHEREAAEVSNGTAGTVSINRNEETRIKDRVGSGEEGLPVYNIEKQDNGVNDRQSIPSNHQGSKDANIRKQRGEGKITINDDEAMETNAETDDQKENRESSSIETQLEESFEDRDSHNARLVDVRQRRAGVGLHGDDNHKMLLNYQEDKQDLSNIHARQECSPQVHVYMHRDEEMVDEDMDGQMEGDKLSEKREEASTMHPDSDVQYEGNERGGTQEVKLVSADKQEHEERHFGSDREDQSAEQNESNSDIKRKTMSDADLEPAEINHTVKKRGKQRLRCRPFTRRQRRKQTNKLKKTTGCFPGFHRRNADQPSESDDDKTPSLTR